VSSQPSSGPTVEPSSYWAFQIAGESRKQRGTEKRNSTRVDEANDRDKTILSEYLSEDINAILPEPIVGPNDTFDPGEEFLKRLTEVAHARVVPPLPAPFTFATTPEALKSNDKLIQDFDFDLGLLFKEYQDTTLNYGSEFRPLDQLEKVLGGHPEFGVLSELISKGMDYKFKKEITEEERERELQGMTTQGNHKSAKKEVDKAAELLAKDVAHGFSVRCRHLL
jgi:hypothetical protein